MTRLAPALILLLLAACGRSEVNPPTQPAAAIPSPAASTAAPAAPTAPPGMGPMLPGAGPANFMGRWAADASWCAAGQGDRRAIEITTTRFEGYENACDVSAITQVDDGYEATLACQAEGVRSSERVRMAVDGDSMRLTWLTRGGVVVPLVRCPRPVDVSTPPPDKPPVS